ncbi:hypothetical protein [Dickeya fangzhongdai]|uniref:hypothetical protein n=1 Tax=Dickeya fangzhongdai TaxID=1778540 RepID=UPI0026DF0070|nr:hypothetical protein [Dickeya fangzhongdai]WKV51063.1 hypothetical protein PL145_01970 [Dickeya fangzhongdai]
MKISLVFRLLMPVQVYNIILAQLGLPISNAPGYGPSDQENERAGLATDGACIRKFDLTSKSWCKEGNEDDYIAGLSTLPYLQHTQITQQWKSVDWLSKRAMPR